MNRYAISLYQVVREYIDDITYIQTRIDDVDPVQVIEAVLGQPIVFKKRIISPLRHENRPSFSFKWIDNTLIFKDFGTNLGGDWKCFLMELWQCDYKTFVKRVSDGNYPGVNHERIELYNKKSAYKIEYSIEPRPFTDLDVLYWQQYYVEDMDKLQSYYHVYSCRSISVNGFLMQYCLPEYIVFAYRVENKFKLYNPYEELGWKWKSNTTEFMVFNLQNMQAGKPVVITSSLKDVIVLELIPHIQAIAAMSETVLIHKNIMETLIANCPIIYIALDQDPAGRTMTEKYLKLYPNVVPLTWDSQYKDPSDFIKHTSWNTFFTHFSNCILDSININA
jgi:hypothetical protein